MANNGVASNQLPNKALLDSFIGNREGSSAQQSFEDLGNQLLGAGPLADEVNNLREQITSGVITGQTFTALSGLSPAVDGTGGEVLDSDAGTHGAATATGYDGSTTPNAGRYSYHLGWDRWVRIGSTGLSDKVSTADLDQAVSAAAIGATMFAQSEKELLTLEDHLFIADSEDGYLLKRALLSKMPTSAPQAKAMAEEVSRISVRVYLPDDFRNSFVLTDALDTVVLSRDPAPLTVKPTARAIFWPDNTPIPVSVSDLDECIVLHSSAETLFSSAGPPTDQGVIICDTDADVLSSDVKGQSNGTARSPAGNGSDAITTVAIPNAERLGITSYGVQSSWNNGQTYPKSGQNFEPFLPLVSTNGEAVGLGVVAMLEKMRADFGLPVKRWVSTVSAVGGLTLQKQRFGGEYNGYETYNVREKNLQAVAANAAAAGQRAARIGMPVIHGESAYVNKETPAQYISTLLQIADDEAAMATRIYKSRGSSPLLITQVGSGTRYGHTYQSIALAQWEASRRSPRIILATPTYPFTYYDGAHFEPRDMRKIGELIGRANFNCAYLGDSRPMIDPLEIKAEVHGNQLRLPFVGSFTRPLKFQIGPVSDPGDFGFRVFIDGQRITLSDMHIENGETVVFTKAGSDIVGRDFVVDYAATGIAGTDSGPTISARGNLCDSDTTPGIEKSIWEQAQGLPPVLQNYCPNFSVKGQLS